MKRMIGAVVVGVAMFVMAGCDGDSARDEAVFNATIVEVAESSITVEPVEGEDILLSADRVTFGTGGLDDIDSSVGDTVTITYTGGIMESYPAQINAVSWSIYDGTAE